MKLKLVVASMSVLGLVSCPVFAATATTDTTTTTVTEHKHQTNMHKAHHGHHVHHRVKHNEEVHEAVHEVHHNYKGEAGSAVVPVCAINESYLIMEEMTQNVGRALPNPCNPGWFNRIALSGGINVDLGKWGNRNTNYMGENYQRLSLNDAYLNVTAMVADWAKAFASISYNTATINNVLSSTATNHLAEYDAAYDNNVLGGASHTLQLEQAFVVLGNFDASPIYVTLGKKFQNFGRYEIHPITEPVTQVMSKMLATSAEVGFIASGFSGSVAVFDDPLPKVGSSATTTNWVVALGYEQPLTCDSLGWDLGIAWTYNLVGANDVAYAVNQFNRNWTPTGDTGYNKRVGGIAVYADVLTGPFYIGARYVQALQKFNSLDLPLHGTSDVTGVAGETTGMLNDGSNGAKPWAGEIHAGVGFNAFFSLDQTLFVGYQQTHQAAGLMLPKHRYVVGYNIDVWKNTTFGIEWDHDNGYSTGSGGNGRNTNLVSLRAAAKFS